MKDQKIIIVGHSDFGKVCEALQAISLETPVIIVEDFKELEQEVFEIQQTTIIEKNHSLLPTKKELHDSKMERLRNRRRK